MAGAAARQPPFPEADDQAAELAALARMLGLSAGAFSLGLAVCNSPALRDYLIERTRESVPGIETVAIPAGCIDIYGHAADALAGRSPAAVFVTNLEAAVPSDAQSQTALKSLNASRDLWEPRFRCPVVFWLPAYLIPLIAANAPDFWRYRSHRFEFVVETQPIDITLANTMPAGYEAAANLDADRKQFRIAELEQRLAEVEAQTDPASIPHAAAWLEELESLYSMCGTLQQVEATARRALELERVRGEPARIAGVLCRLASVLAADKRIEEASVAADEALRLSRGAGDTRVEIDALRQLSQVERQRGDQLAALRTCTEAMRIANAQGDDEMRLSAALDLAGLQVETGNLYEAERILKSVLPPPSGEEKLLARDRVLAHLADLAVSRRAYGEAAALLGEALEIEEQLGLVFIRPWTFGMLGFVAHYGGDTDKAQAYLQKSFDLAAVLGTTEVQAMALELLSDVARSRGDSGQARELLARARDIRVRRGETPLAAALQTRIDRLAEG